MDSTSGLLSVLDLNRHQNQNMEDMDIDHIVDIPDTPDRVAACHNNGGESFGKESNSSVAGHAKKSNFMDEECSNQPRCRGRLVTENGHHRRLHIHPRKNPSNVDEIEYRNKSIVFPSLENSHASQNALLFRRSAVDKNSKHETRHSIGARHMDKGKAICPKFPSKSSACQVDNAVLDLTEQNWHNRILEMAFPRGASNDLAAEEIREAQTAVQGSSLNFGSSSSKTSVNSCKGKEKIDDNTRKGAGSPMVIGKGINLASGSQHKTEKQMFAFHHSVTSPKVAGQKRLVRNGCISPLNIAIRARQLDDHYENSIKDVEQNHTRNEVSNGPCLIGVSDLIAEDNNCDGVKGKGLVVHPCMSAEHDEKIIHLPSSNPMINDEEANVTSDVIRGAVGCSEELSGWRSTHKHSNKIEHPLSDAAEHRSGRNVDVGHQQHGNRVVKRDNRSAKNNRDAYHYPEDLDAAQKASRPLSEVDRISEPRRATNTLTKRQKKHGLISSNNVECSRTKIVSDESELAFLGPSRGSSSSRSSRSQSHQHRGILNPVFEIDESSPEMKDTHSHDMGCANNDDLDARARQLEADEMLARELQEQLYHEVPIFGDGEIDENIAWALQQEDALRAASSQNHPARHHRSSSMTHSRRQPQLRSFQNPSNRRATQARVPTSTTMAQLRSRVFSRSPAASSTDRNFRFPNNMDIDTRLDILEALEAAVGDLNDVRMASHMLHLHRDFNENDYEMLLALDENNHQHVGSSIQQINSLPQSTVQTDNFEEACAICLETPSTGETIRHLPCLHKFHKDCIDPWLSRSTSCPVCKSSIT